MVRIKALFLLLVVMCLLIACEEKSDHGSYQLEFIGEEKIMPTNLRDTIISYYTAENNAAWTIAYSIRSDEFKKLVPYQAYEKEMQKGMDGWNLIKVEILSEIESLNEEEKEKTFNIRFYEKFDDGASSSSFLDSGIQTNVEETVWKYVGGTWVCVQAGERGHLPLNIKMVY